MNVAESKSIVVRNRQDISMSNTLCMWLVHIFSTNDNSRPRTLKMLIKLEKKNSYPNSEPKLTLQLGLFFKIFS